MRPVTTRFIDWRHDRRLPPGLFNRGQFKRVLALNGGWAKAAETAVALLIIEDGGEQIGSLKIRPKRLGDINLGVRNLPQKKIADAHLAGGAYQKIRFGHACGVQARRDGLFVDAQAVQAAFEARIFNNRVHRVHEFGAAAVVDGDVELHPRVARRALRGGLQFRAHWSR